MNKEKINKDIKDLNKIINQFDLIDIYFKKPPSNNSRKTQNPSSYLEIKHTLFELEIRLNTNISREKMNSNTATSLLNSYGECIDL